LRLRCSVRRALERRQRAVDLTPDGVFSAAASRNCYSVRNPHGEIPDWHPDRDKMRRRTRLDEMEDAPLKLVRGHDKQGRLVGGEGGANAVDRGAIGHRRRVRLAPTTSEKPRNQPARIEPTCPPNRQDDGRNRLAWARHSNSRLPSPQLGQFKVPPLSWQRPQQVYRDPHAPAACHVGPRNRSFACS
jgi:hypothetical protein